MMLMGKMLQKKKLKENDVLLFTASKYTLCHTNSQ